MTPQERADKTAAIMWENDAASKGIGILMGAVGPGTATLSLQVKSRHLNGHAICHGGLIFTLADAAFAFACNSYNENTLAQNNSITYISPARINECLTATACEVSKLKRSGIYDVCVTADDGRVVAQFRGHSRQIKGQHFDE